jgi:hypothetical protein
MLGQMAEGELTIYRAAVNNSKSAHEQAWQSAPAMISPQPPNFTNFGMQVLNHYMYEYLI